jgi:hypothetical protein
MRELTMTTAVTGLDTWIRIQAPLEGFAEP